MAILAIPCWHLFREAFPRLGLLARTGTRPHLRVRRSRQSAEGTGLSLTQRPGFAYNPPSEASSHVY
jgi:hypothetical protein